MWSEEYDRSLPELFAVHEEITRRLMTALAVAPAEGESERVWRASTDNVEAYDAYLRGLELDRRSTPEANALAVTALEKAIELDANFTRAYASLGTVHIRSVKNGWSRYYFDTMERAFAVTQQALALDESEPEAHAILGFVHALKQEPELAIHELQSAVALCPNCSSAKAHLANALLRKGRPEEALPHIRSAIRLEPFHPSWYILALGNTYRRMGRHEDAIGVLNEYLRQKPEDFDGHILLVAAYVRAGLEERAKTGAAEIMRLFPNFSLDSYEAGAADFRPIKETWHVGDYYDRRERIRIVDSLRKAGME